jgi:hypothetical protein
MINTRRQINLHEFVQELKRENLQKKDFVIPSNNLIFRDGKLVVINQSNNEQLRSILQQTGIGYSSDISGGEMTLDCLPVFHSQVAEKLGIPKKYYDKMLSDEKGKHVPILDQNVSYWFNNNNSKYLLRSFVDKEEKSGVARALLSDRFKIIDNYDVLLAVLAAVKESGMNLEVDESGCDITEKRMYMRFICPEIEINAPELLKNYHLNSERVTNHGIVSGFVISNSEVGLGTLSIAPRAKILACKNGMIKTDERFARTHLGGKVEEYKQIEWSEETRQKNYELIIAQVKDAIKAYTNKDYLGNWVSDLITKGTKPLEHPLDCVKNVSSALKISEEKEKEILNFFIKSADFTGFGVTQAITLFAHTKADADEQYELEKASVSVLDRMSQYDRPVPKKTNQEAIILN